MIKISVIVPVYNVEDYIARCLDSLVNQTLKDMEIIVVNDGTKDNSQDIIDKYVKKYKNVKSFIKENGGLSSARNFGIKKAKGDYISFIDSDDYVELDMFEKMYKKIIEDKSDVAICDSINVYDDGSKEYIHTNLHYSDSTIKNYVIAPPMACIRLFKRSLFKKVSFELNRFYEDLNLVPYIIDQTDKVSFVEEGLYFYYQRSGSIMKQTTFNNKLLDIFYVLDNNYKILYNKYPEEVEYLYITHLLRTASLRFLDYKEGTEYLYKINDIMKERFPNWKNNKYYLKSSKKLKLICNLSYNKHYILLRLIKKLKNR